MKSKQTLYLGTIIISYSIGILLLSNLIIKIYKEKQECSVRRGKNQEWMKYLENNNLLISNSFYKGYINSKTRQIDSLPTFVELFNKFNITSHDHFMDIGSGIGLMCFAMKKRYDFGKIIGIELNKKTYDYSIQNLKIMKMDNISFINKSFFDYNIPKTVSFAYAFNPFHYDIIAFNKVVDKLEGRNNLILIWMNIYLNNEYTNILLKKSKSFETGINIYPYIIIYF